MCVLVGFSEGRKYLRLLMVFTRPNPKNGLSKGIVAKSGSAKRKKKNKRQRALNLGEPNSAIG